MKKGNSRANRGFTIVELLVVIVVIGVLAAITIVSYAGISSRANTATLQSDLDNASKILKMYYTMYSTFPALDVNNCPTTPTVDNNYCLKVTSGGVYQYQVNSSTDPQTFCITETKSNLSYYINQDLRPTIGGCPGDIVSGSPAIVNPSFESDTIGNLSYPAQWTQYGNVANSYEGVANDFAVYGTKSFKISQTTTDMDGGVWGRISGLTIGQKVTVSAWIRSGAGVVNASLDLCTSQHGLTGSQSTTNNQGANVNGRFSVTLNSVDQTAVDVFLGQGSWGSYSHGDVWFDGIQVTVQ